MKKSQISQVFTYLMAIIVVGLIVFVGYKGIAWIMNSQCRQSEASFEKNLIEFIDDYSDRGSVHEEILAAPCDATQVCFLDSSYCPRDESSIYVPDFGGDGVVASSANDCTANIFVKGKYTRALMYQDKLALSGEPFQCFDVRQGKVKLLFSGTGRKTIVSLSALSELPEYPYGGDVGGGGSPEAPGPTPDAQSEAKIFFYPSSRLATTNSFVELEIRASDLPSLYGFWVTIQYDPVILEFADFQQGSWMSNNGAVTVYCDYILEPGKVKDLFCTRISDPNGVSGNGILGKLSFRAKAAGQSALTLSDVILSNPDLVQVAVITTDGSVVVN